MSNSLTKFLEVFYGYQPMKRQHAVVSLQVSLFFMLYSLLRTIRHDRYDTVDLRALEA